MRRHMFSCPQVTHNNKNDNKKSLSLSSALNCLLCDTISNLYYKAHRDTRVNNNKESGKVLCIVVLHCLHYVALTVLWQPSFRLYVMPLLGFLSVLIISVLTLKHFSTTF